MNRRKSLPANGAAAPVPEWDPNSKRRWFFEFEKEPVNDEKWSCIVTAAVQNEAEDEETIQIYTECVNTGLRKAVRVISMADVVKLLKGNNEGNNTKREVRRSKTEKPTKKTPLKAPAQVVALAAKYAIYTATECILPPELMAAVLKCMILNLKDESCLQKRTDAVWERKIRNENIKAKFIRDLKPYVGGTEMLKPYRKVPPNILELEEPINDDPVAGPDLYILLTDFYNVFYFAELQTINVPFLAVLKITKDLEKPRSASESCTTTGDKRKSGFGAFWKSLKECEVSERFKEIAVMEYRAPSMHEDIIKNYMTVFDELTWTQYSVYCIYRQHQKYLQELQEQRLIVSLEPLDLSKCVVYNKLCDALITGEPLTPLLVLYAIVEQVVAGVPETKSLVLEHRPKPTDFFASPTALSDEKSVPLVTSCRNKKEEHFTAKVVENALQSPSSSEDWAETSENTENSVSLSTHLEGNSTPNSSESVSTPLATFESLINKVLSEKRTEKEAREDRKWKTPILCFYGDSVALQTYYCDSRLFNSRTIVARFFRNSAIPLLWKNYPELSREERALCNFHFYTFQKLSKQREDVVKLKLFFTLSMNLIRKVHPREYYFEKSQAEDEKGKLNVRLSQDLVALLKENNNDFPSYFLRTFILGIKRDNVEDILESIGDKDSLFHCTATSVLRMTHSNTSSDSSSSSSSRPPICFSPIDIPTPQSPSSDEKDLLNLYSILNCGQISSLTELCFQSDRGDNLKLIQDFKFYENLEPDLMIQRLVEAKENFNAVQSLYFSPTDTLVIVMYNECDERGIFQTTESGVLATPVGLKDFHRHVYPDIRNWLAEEVADHARFTSELKERAKAKEEKKDAEYFASLRRKYCELSEEKRKEFLEKTVISEPEVGEKELGELPVKPKPVHPNKVSFVGTSFAEARVENRAVIREFHSQDGTEVSATIDSWLHTSSELLKIRIKRLNFLLYYNQWLGETETNPNFTLKTFSGMIFSFYKDTDVDSNYSLTISWPTGLLIRPVFLPSGVYIRQTYLKPYRMGWQIEEENSRCFLKNGQVVIVKKNGDYDVLCGSGTKYSFYESATVPRYEIMSTTGEVWQIRTKGPCKNRRTLITVNKVFLGVDPDTKEAFYKREDGTYCMLWPNGRLVTNYPDGTKITSTPYFDEKEVTVDWTEEEKLYFEELEWKQSLEEEPRSRTILRNSSSPETDRKMSDVTGFVPVSCAYLMEHPKYSSVNFNPNDPYVNITMPEEVRISVHPDGNYEVWHKRSFLTVRGSTVEFCASCPDCQRESRVSLHLDSNVILCECVDFFQKAFFVYRDGRTNFQECYNQTDGGEAVEGTNVYEKTCSGTHYQDPSLKQRCFAFDRDLRGTEFIHSDCLAYHFQLLPEETHYELNTDDQDSISHTFNSPYFKVGYENWVMSYEDSRNSLPTNLKKKDLKEIGAKQVTKNLFKYPFPKHHNCSQQHSNKGRRNVREPKVIIWRAVGCLAQDPNSLMAELQKCVQAYREKALGIFNAYKNHTVVTDRSYDSRYVEMRLRKIALTLGQSLKMYPHLCTNLPSTEKDIHYFGHFIHSMNQMKAHFHDDLENLPNCEQIPNRLPRSSHFPSIHEENEPPVNA